jgi:predicted dehydrogenase
MLRTLVVGLSREGACAHLPVLAALRDTTTEPLFDDHPMVVCDTRAGARPFGDDISVVDGLERAARIAAPDRTVVHVCTPPGERLPLLTRLAELGFRRLVVDEPLTTDVSELDGIQALRERVGLDIVVAGHWQTASLSQRLGRIVGSSRFGALRSVTVAQHRPRFADPLTNEDLPTAFDVELPHSLAVVLDLAGPADLADAEWADLACVGRRVRRLGSARLILRHHDGVHSTLYSNLMSPVFERRITLRLDGAIVTGSYPLGEDDNHAQLRVVSDGVDQRAIFPDDTLRTLLLSAYRYFDGGPAEGFGDFEAQCAAVRLLASAKKRCAGKERHTVGTQPTAPTVTSAPAPIPAPRPEGPRFGAPERVR